jgi:ribosomal protein S17E
MTVIFSTKSGSQNRYTINNLWGTDDKGEKVNFGQVYFRKGVLTTSDKELIKALMQYGGYFRGDYDLVTNPEEVANYLDGEESDILTKEILDTISIEGIKKLGKLLGAKKEQPTLIKIEIEGSPITNSVQELLDFYFTNENKPQEPQSEIEKFEVVDSSKFDHWKKAVAYIEETPKEKLKNFIADGETRKSILEAYKEKMDN